MSIDVKVDGVATFFRELLAAIIALALLYWVGLLSLALFARRNP